MGAGIQAIGFQDVQRLFNGMESRVKNLKPALEVCGQRMIRSTEQNFREGGRPSKWTPSKRVQKFGGKTLVQSGRLKNSVDYKAEKNRLTVGTNVVYAAPHQWGLKETQTVRSKKGKTFRRKQNIPQRQFLLVQPADTKYNGKICAHYVATGRLS